MNKIFTILSNSFPQEDWQIEKPKDAWSKECYIAKNDKYQLFIKFDINIEIIKRLSDIKVCPKILAHGEHIGSSYFIQEYIPGRYPTKIWIKSHFKDLSVIIKKYHEDKILTELLKDIQPIDYRQHIQKDLKGLRDRIDKLHIKGAVTDQMIYSFKRLKIEAQKLTPTRLVPTHYDLNKTNFIIYEHKIYIIDWDEINLSDPLKDIGILLWKYIPQAQWKLYYELFDRKYSKGIENKIYWFSQRIFLETAIWYFEHRLNGSLFIPGCNIFRKIA